MERRKSILFPTGSSRTAESNHFDETRDTLLSSINDSLRHDDTEMSLYRQIEKLSSRQNSFTPF